MTSSGFIISNVRATILSPEEDYKAIETELNYILNKRNSEGIWDITWAWGAYEKEFSISQNWWKAHIIIEYLQLLRNFGRF